MLHRCWPLPVAIVAFAGSAALAQNEYSIKPVLKPGDQFAYSIGMVLDVAQRAGDAAPENTSSLRSSATVRMKVLEVGPEGTAKLEAVFEKASVQAPVGEQPVGFEWPTKEPLPDDAEPVKKLAEPLMKSTVMLEVDPKGKVTVQGGLESFSAAAAKLDYPDDRHLGFFTEEKLATVLTPIFNMDGAGDAPRTLGKGWQTTETIVTPPVGGFDFTTDFIVDSVNVDVVVASGGINITLKRAENAGDDVARVALDPSSGGGTRIEFDTRRGLLKYRKNSLTLKTIWTLGDASLTQTQLSVLNLKLVEE